MIFFQSEIKPSLDDINDMERYIAHTYERGTSSMSFTVLQGAKDVDGVSDDIIHPHKPTYVFARAVISSQVLESYLIILHSFFWPHLT